MGIYDSGCDVIKMYDGGATIKGEPGGSTC